jgi:hypothetical protein
MQTKPEEAQRREPEWTGIAVGAATSVLVFNAFVFFACVAATAQTPGPNAPSSAPVASPAPSERQGFFDAFGNWVQQGVANAGAGFGAMVGAVGGQATQAAKGAADAARNVTKLPVSSVTAGRERCVLAPNGAPDCGAAAAALCRAQGYAGGSSVDFETVEKCPPRTRTRVSGRDAPERLCTMEHFVTKALCQ